MTVANTRSTGCAKHKIARKSNSNKHRIFPMSDDNKRYLGGLHKGIC